LEARKGRKFHGRPPAALSLATPLNTKHRWCKGCRKK